MNQDTENPDESDLSRLSIIPIGDIRCAADCLKGKIARTPLICLNVDDGDTKVYLKLENLQPVGSFKLRGAYNALASLSEEEVRGGVYTCSAGNFGQGLAWSARERGVPCQVVVPNTAPHIKLDAIKRLGGEIIAVPYDTWWKVMINKHYDGMTGRFVHPVCDQQVIAGNGTIGLEIVEDLPEVDVVIGPFGGGGHLCGIASAVKALKPEIKVNVYEMTPVTKVLACEVDVAAPLTACRKAGKSVTLTDHKSTFVDGMGGKTVLKEMWNLVSNLIDDTILLTVKEISDAVRLLVERNHVVAEGAGAAPVAAALRSHEATKGKNIVCVISGGNIDTSTLITILQGQVPETK